NWSKAKRLGKNINTPYHESSACYSYDSKTLYFVSDKPEDSYGDHDIYLSHWDEDKEEWGEPKNLGPAVNTPLKEESVYMHPDGKTLYFSSQGHMSMGGLDIFKSVLEDGKWSTPENLGYPINSADKDVFFVIGASGKRGYYSSYKKSGYGREDIYMITFLGPEKEPVLNGEDNLLASVASPVKEKVVAKKVEIKTSNLTILKGVISDEKTGDPLEATIEIMDNTKNEKVATFKSNRASGKYLVSLPAGRNYGISVNKVDYLFHSENVNVPANVGGYSEIIRDVTLKKFAVGTKIILRNIFFPFDKYDLTPESNAELQKLVKLLKDMPSLKIRIGGHTDSKGSDVYNQKLSENRAKTVVQYLISNKISKDRLEFAGYGEVQPVSTNDTDEGRQENRRIEFEIISN
ncbi:MAG: OmpA family protein, partial [Flavobacteriales bacterium]|nr:OmpA family protein [Flavobacteriales bacterium]